ncbi:hypothetical protein Rruber_03720 [Rhodococcus ruber]|uniref:DoxX family protein n=1 Tax=Rhodococcus ruber TaxID=1830 RepID=UPI00315D22AE
MFELVVLMNTALWVIAALLALIFLAAGAMKLRQPKDELAANPNRFWAEEFSPATIKLLGALEVLAAIEFIVPAMLDIVLVAVPLTAVGLALLMIGAAITHTRRKRTNPSW